MSSVLKRDAQRHRRRCPCCSRSMRLAKLIRWHFGTEWLACPHCDTYVKPSYYEMREAHRGAA